MEQPFSTSKVTVEYSDPHDVYRLLAPGLIPRLPLRHLHWQSHAGPLRSIDTLHVELTAAQSDPFSVTSPAVTPGAQPRSGSVSGSASGRDDGFQTASIGGRAASTETVGSNPALATKAAVGKEQRHQIPGLRRTPYLKVLLVRCDDNDSYKSQVRGEIREWIKSNTSSVSALKKSGAAANHDSFELMIIHVVIPNTVAATQPRISGKAPDGSSNPDLTKTSSRWGKSSSTLLEKLRADFNSSGKVSVDRVAQIRIGVNDVPYDMLPRVVPAVPTGYSENEKDAENAWTELIDKMKDLILSSFDKRVGQYEEDIREKDTQRSLPGWNFCTFFILKEGLARGFESVGLVEDALVGYDELSVGLDTIVQEQTVAGSATTHGGSLLNYTDDLKKMAQKAVASIVHGNIEYEGDEETVDLQSKDKMSTDYVEDIPISSTKKQYREMILANNVSVFDFRCYIFSRQIALLLRLGNAWSSREELLAKLKEQQESVLCGVASNVPLPKATDETENLSMLAEICRRTLEFIPALSQLMRQDILAAIADKDFHTAELGPDVPTEAALAEVVDNIVTSYAFSIAQQVLAQTSTKALPIPPSTLASPKDAHEPKASIPEPKTMMHPARSSSLNVRPGSRPPPSPGVFPGGTGRRNSVPGPEKTSSHFLKAGLEDLAARRAELYALSRNILEECGKKRGWSDGWVSVPIVGETGVEEMDEINLDDEVAAASELKETMPMTRDAFHTVAGFDNRLLRTALDNKEDFYRLYETLTDKALRHYNVAGHIHSVNANMADLAVLKYHLGDYSGARECFYQSTPFFGESGWTLLELSMLVMYSKCLQRLQRKPDFVRAALKLLTKAAMAERERINDKTALRIGRTVRPTYPDKDAIRGVLDELIEASKELPEDEYIPLTTLFTNIDIEGAPVYQDRQDSFSITLQLHSLLVDELGVDHAKVRLVGHAGNATREVWVESTSPLKLSPGKNKIQLHSNVIVPGIYEVAQVRLSSGKLCLVHDRDTTQTATLSPSHVLRHPRITLYQRSGAFDVRMSSARHMQLDKNNCLDLELLSGWNEVTNCELRVKPATGGLRLLTSETKVVENGEGKPLKPTEGSLFNFKSLPAGTSVKIQFPFTTDQDVVSVSVRVDVTYSTEHGSFTFSKTPSVNVGLALGVNVQDVFKHAALFERFTVSTATASPLRLYRSELLDSDIFESHFGTAPDRPITIFPKQPAGLLYKVTRRHDQIKSKAKKTMYLKLYYSVVQEELSSLVEKSLSEELSSDTPLSDLSRLLTSTVVQHIQKGWSGDDLERVTLLGEFSTAFLANVHWERYFTGLGCSPLDGSDLSQAAADFIREWQRKHPKLPLLETDPDESELQTILIPVDIPSLTIVHTADIRLQEGVPSLLDGTNTDLLEPETVCVNQLIPATLHLKWTRIWDTGSSETGVVLPPNSTDLEFSYEVSAPADTWLLSGRRKGHFVIPAPQNAEGGEGMSSTPDTEADIPLLLIPLREGYLPYPTVDIREVHSTGGGLDEHTFAHASDTDHRNLGETVRVVADRARVTVSLDASGPGGGPLVLESEGRGLEGRIVV